MTRTGFEKENIVFDYFLFGCFPLRWLNLAFMKIYLYLSLIPESLIASMLPPEEFGNYYAVGNQKHSRGQAFFFEVDPSKLNDSTIIEEMNRRCVPHEDGRPRRSTYLRIYRALESVPTAALGRLHLVTSDGRDLAIEKGKIEQDPARGYHLYQEICPVNPRVASKLAAPEFGKQLTDPKALISVPRIVFCELKLWSLAADVDSHDVNVLPYPNIEHLRDCLRELKNAYAKPNKTVIRHMEQDVLFRTIRGGFYVVDSHGTVEYPFPSLEELETKYYPWWRSALSTYGG